MYPSPFESRFASIQEKLDKAKGKYDFKTKEETWGNIGINPLDVAFTELSELYLESDESQKKHIYDSIAANPCLYDIFVFVQRVGKRIKSEADSKWLEIGIAAAKIDGARTDFRELILSLILLRFAAESYGIDTKPFFDRAIQNTDEELVQILENVRDHSQEDIQYTVQMFGDPDWVSQSVEKYGEYLDGSTDQKWQEEKKSVRSIAQNILIIILLIGLCILAIYIRSRIDIPPLP